MRFKSIEAISALQMAVRGAYDGAADVNRDGRDTSLDALMILQVAAGDLASEHGFEKIAVTGGIGVREYYRKHGYVREGAYMVIDAAAEVCGD